MAGKIGHKVVKPVKVLYAAHVSNLRALNAALTHVHRQLNYLLASEQDIAAQALLKIYVFLIGAWAEVRLLKMLHEPHAAADVHRQKILAESTQLDRWKMSIEVGFRSKHNVPIAPLSKYTLPATQYFLFEELVNLINEELSPIISIRNKLAHGQWSRILTANLDDFSPDMMALLNTENALSAKLKRNILEYLCRIIHDLFNSPGAFQRDFDTHHRNLMQTKRNLSTQNYKKWLTTQKAKLKRGRS